MLVTLLLINTKTRKGFHTLHAASVRPALASHGVTLRVAIRLAITLALINTVMMASEAATGT